MAAAAGALLKSKTNLFKGLEELRLYLTIATIVVSFSWKKGGRTDLTIRYMIRPVAHCKEGCSILSWA